MVLIVTPSLEPEAAPETVSSEGIVLSSCCCRCWRRCCRTRWKAAVWPSRVRAAGGAEFVDAVRMRLATTAPVTAAVVVGVAVAGVGDQDGHPVLAPRVWIVEDQPTLAAVAVVPGLATAVDRSAG